MNQTQLLLIPLLPLAAFLLLGIGGRSAFRRSAGVIGTLIMAAATLLSLIVAAGYFFSWGKAGEIYQKLVPFKITWLEFSPGLSIDMGILLDPISAMMLVVVSVVSLMVHIFSLSYMKGEERFSTYYAFLSLFTFSMLGLVLSSNLFQIYMFWELVGVSSFLLIGFYYDKPSAVAAAKKAFIVTRFADLGFLIGILMLAFQAGSLDFLTIIDNLTSPESRIAVVSLMGLPVVGWSLMLIYAGAAGKSAMFPLHIWLPDAMEGPTPVSALIHAATMVVAGVFLVARLFPVYAMAAPDTLDYIALIGAFSALFAAIIACTQTDIKRVLAYSTMSQIGFMMLALGVSGYGGEAGLGFTASQFHLLTHALFKALLFLGAGVVIHHIHSNEMKVMGGLRSSLPVTHITFLVGCLAIAGIPPLSGFFSKEEILLAAYERNRFVFWIAIVTAALTAFYMFRLYFSIFWRDKKESHHHKPHGEGGPAIVVPLIILGVGAVAAGFIPFGKFVSSDGAELKTSLHLMFSILPVGLSIASILFASWLYRKENNRAENMVKSAKGLYRLAKNKFFIDEIYLFITKKIMFNLIGRPAAWIDKNIIDGLVNLTGNRTLSLSERIKKFQSGRVQQYGMVFLAGLIILSVALIYYFSQR